MNGRIQILFAAGALLLCACPEDDPKDTATPPVDTGPADTGDSGEPSDTGDSGEPSDTGDSGEPSDTGDSGEPSDTGDSGDPGIDADGDGYTAEEGDCDDADPAVNPGATEVCEDGIDNDCDGYDAACRYQGDLEIGEAAFRMMGEEAGGYAGSAVGSGDWNADGERDFVVGAENYQGGGWDLGAAYVVLGPLTADITLTDSTALRVVAETDQSFAGSAVGTAGDVDADGVEDLLVGAYSAENPSGSDSGVVWLLQGPVTGAGHALGGDVADTVLYTDDSYGWVGYHLDGGGDTNGDGYDDVLIGAPGTGSFLGAAYLLQGPLSSGSVNLESTAAGTLTGGQSSDSFAYHVGLVGDIDADGNDDVMVGASGNDDGANQAGAAYLFHGPVSGTNAAFAADSTLLGTVLQDSLGCAFDGAGDVNGDGYQDLLLGAEGFQSSAGNPAGRAFLVYGSAGGLGEVSVEDVAQATFEGESSGADAGSAVAGVGDLDADGHDDLLIGAYSESGGPPGSGVAYVIYGPSTGTSSLADADARILGDANGQYVGTAVAGAGDTDGDGKSDFLVTGFGESGNTGAAWLFLGGGAP